MRDLAGNLNSNIDRLVPSREDVEKQQQIQQQQQQQQMMMQQQMQQQQMAAEEAKMLQEDGTEMGGRQDNYISSRPGGK
jgi:hypothetical protein